MEEEHKKLVSRMIASTEGRVGSLHKNHKTGSLDRRCANAGRGGNRCQALDEM